MGFCIPPKLPSTGNEEVDQLIVDYNKAQYLLGASKDGLNYIVTAKIETPPGWRGECVVYTKGNGQLYNCLLTNFENFVDGITCMVDIDACPDFE